jgi:glycosyltransferase involved in cell wall biosynthesis
MTTDNFDAEFYRLWYKDIRGMTAEQAAAHWEKAGRKEGRVPNYSQLLASKKALGLELPKGFRWKEYLALNGDLPRPGQWSQVNAEMHYLDAGQAEGRHHSYPALLKARKLDLKDLPADFNWQAYLALNPNLIPLHINSRYLAEAHYLEYGSKESLDYRFDPDFYLEYHGLSRLEQSFDAALLHFTQTGSKSDLAPTFARLLGAEGLPSSLLPPRFDHAQFKRLRSALGDTKPYHSLLELLRGSCVSPTTIADTQVANLNFYKHVALQYERDGKDGKAYQFYSAALFFGVDSAIYESLGNIAMRSGRKPAALAWYKNAITLEGYSPFVFINGSRLLIEQNDPAKAIDFAAMGVKYRPADASFLENNFRETAKAHWELVAQAIQPELVTGNRSQAVELVQRMADSQFAAWLRLLNPTGGALPQPNGHGRSVLIVGDHHIPQCIRYRIAQKTEQLEAAGYSVAVADWCEPERASELLPWSDIVIFYRVPALPDTIQLMASARAHGKLVFYEVDDLVFDPVYPHPIESFGGLVDVQQYQDLQQGMALMRAAASLCDYGIASTRPLQAALEPLVRQKVCYLHRNGLDSQTLIASEPLDPDAKGYVNLFYGSGTKAHNSDFIVEALPAIERLLSEYPQLKLTVVGHLELPERVWKQHRDQIVQIEHVANVQAYWNYLAASHINLAVLTADTITNTKSELKWFEAACFRIPSVVSATLNYLDVINDGVDGFIAHEPEDWYRALKTLLDDPAKRQAMGQTAHDRVIKEYSVPSLTKSIDQTIRAALTHATQSTKRRSAKPAKAALA